MPDQYYALRSYDQSYHDRLIKLRVMPSAYVQGARWAGGWPSLHLHFLTQQNNDVQLSHCHTVFMQTLFIPKKILLLALQPLCFMTCPDLNVMRQDF